MSRGQTEEAPTVFFLAVEIIPAFFLTVRGDIRRRT